MGQSDSLLIALVLVWCLVGSLVGGLCRLLWWLLNHTSPTSFAVDIIVGAVGALGAAYWSGVIDRNRPPLPGWPDWVRSIGALVEDHQTGVAVISATVLVMGTNLVVSRLQRRWPVKRLGDG